MTGIVQLPIANPMELVKIRMQIYPTLYNNTWDCMKKLYREGKTLMGGIKSMNRGLSHTFARDSVSYGTYFAGYEYTKYFLIEKMEMNGLITLPLSMFISGGAAGVISWSSIYPIDVMKSRYQSIKGDTQIPLFKFYLDTYRKEGLGIFWRGMFCFFITPKILIMLLF